MPLARANKRPRKGRRVAVLVGVNAYRDGVDPLRNAVNDIDLVAPILGKEHGFSIKRIVEDNATVPRLKGLLRELAKSLEPEDRFIFYFSGHGEVKQGTELDRQLEDSFLLLHDAKKHDPATYFSMREMLSLLDALPCRHLLLILDCCFSGAIRSISRGEPWSELESRMYEELYERYQRSPAWFVLTSTQSHEVAPDRAPRVDILGELGRSGQNSPFAIALYLGLKGDADFPIPPLVTGDGVITIRELHQFIEGIFAHVTTELKRPQQTPMLFSLHRRDEGQFLFHNPRQPPILPQAIEISTKNNPYRGFAPFSREQSAWFFGRSEETDELFQLFAASPVTYVVGDAGVGKTSLVQAGLIAKVLSTGAAGIPAALWRVVSAVRLGPDAQEQLRGCARELHHSADQSLAQAVAALHTEQPSVHILLFLDGPEGLREPLVSDALVQEVWNSLTAAVKAAPLNVHLVCTLRRDYESECKTRLAALVKAAGITPAERYVLARMRTEKLREAALGPAHQRCLFWEPRDIVERIVESLQQAPGALALFSFTLHAMYNDTVRRARDRVLRLQDPALMWLPSGALYQKATADYQSLSQKQRTALGRILFRLTTPPVGNGDPVSLRRIPWREIQEEPRDASSLPCRQAAEQLLLQRWLTTDGDAQKTPALSLACAELGKVWPEAWALVRERPQEQVLLHNLIAAEREWQQDNRSFLSTWWLSPPLGRALKLRAALPGLLSQFESSFVEASRRWRRIGGLVSTLLLLSLTAVSLWQRYQASRTEAQQQFVLGHQALTRGDSTDALRKFLAANKVISHPDLPYLVRRAMEPEDAVVHELWGHEHAVTVVRFSPDGRWLLAGDEVGELRLWNASTYQQSCAKSWPEHAVEDLRFSASRDSAVISASDQFLRLNFTTCEVSAIPAVCPPNADCTLSPDGSRVLFQNRKSMTIGLMNLDNGQRTPLRNDQNEEVLASEQRFSADGRRVFASTIERTDLTITYIFDVSDAALVSCRPFFTQLGPFIGSSLHDSILVSNFVDQVAVWDAGAGNRSLPEAPLTAGSCKRRPLVSHIRDLAGISSSLGLHAVFAMSPDGQTVATVSKDRPVQLWAWRENRLLHNLDSSSAKQLSLKFSPDSQRLLGGSELNEVRIWNVANGARLATLRLQDQDRQELLEWDSKSHLLASPGPRGTVRIWDTAPSVFLGGSVRAPNESLGGLRAQATGKGVLTVWTPNQRLCEDSKYAPSESVIRQVGVSLATPRIADVSDDAKYVAATADARRARIEFWDETLNQQSVGTPLIVPTSAAPGTLVVWETASQSKTIHILEPKLSSFRLAAFGKPKDQQQILLTAESLHDSKMQYQGLVKLYRLPSETPFAQIESRNIPAEVSFSADGHRLAILYHVPPRSVQVWNLDPWREVSTVEPAKEPSQRRASGPIALSPDGKLLLIASETTVGIWSVEEAKLLRVLVAGTAEINKVAFSSDSERVFALDRKQGAYLWGQGSGLLLSHFVSEMPVVEDVLLRNDRVLLVSSSQSELWQVAAETRTADELNNFLICSEAPRAGKLGSTPVQTAECGALKRMGPPLPFLNRHETPKCENALPLAPPSPKASAVDITQDELVGLWRLALETQDQPLHPGRPDYGAQLTVELRKLETTELKEFAYARATQAYDEQRPEGAAFAYKKALEVLGKDLTYQFLWVEALLILAKQSELRQIDFTSMQKDVDADPEGEQLVVYREDGIPQRSKNRVLVAWLAWNTAVVLNQPQPRQRWAAQLADAYRQLPPDFIISWQFTRLLSALARADARSSTSQLQSAVTTILDEKVSPASKTKLQNLLLLAN